jgi:hypothetical protein
MALRTHYLPSGVLKCDYGEFFEAIFQVSNGNAN